MTQIGRYTLRPGTLRSIKSAVTRAKNRKDWDAVLQIYEKAEGLFVDLGEPEDMAEFMRALFRVRLEARIALGFCCVIPTGGIR